MNVQRSKIERETADKNDQNQEISKFKKVGLQATIKQRKPRMKKVETICV